MEPNMPEFILFGDSLTEWSFDEETEGFGQFLEKRYLGKARVVNEGKTAAQVLLVAASEL
jgi:lysophospholipase L1-like esterase